MIGCPMTVVADAPEHLAPAQGASKSQRKREAAALQALGEQLVDLKPAQLAKMPLPPELLAAVLAAQGMRQRGAHKRQRQYIGRLMRSLDPEPVRIALLALESNSAAARQQQQYRERLCDALIAGDEAALATLLERHPAIDRPYLDRLIGDAAQASGEPVARRRALLRYLRALDSAVSPELAVTQHNQQDVSQHPKVNS